MATKYVPAYPDTLRWVREDIGLTHVQVEEKTGFPVDQLRRWETGTDSINLTQAKKLADLYKISVPVFYLKKIPEEWTRAKPVDFRRPENRKPYSRRLCLAIRDAEARQQWMRERALSEKMQPLEWLYFYKGQEKTTVIANWILDWLNVDRIFIQNLQSDKEALIYWIEKLEAKGVVVATNSTHAAHKIDHSEYSGLVLYDDYAPFILLNPQDSPARRIFTLIHELAHLLLDNRDGLSKIDFRHEVANYDPLETLCNRVASRVLISDDFITGQWREEDDIEEQISALAKKLKVSHSAIAVRLREQNQISQSTLDELLAYYRKLYNRSQKSSGGRSLPDKQALDRCGKLFTRSVLDAYEQGNINAIEIYDLLGVKLKHLAKLSERLQFPLHRWVI